MTPLEHTHLVNFKSWLRAMHTAPSSEQLDCKKERGKMHIIAHSQCTMQWVVKSQKSPLGKFSSTWVFIWCPSYIPITKGAKNVHSVELNFLNEILKYVLLLPESDKSGSIPHQMNCSCYVIDSEWNELDSNTNIVKPKPFTIIYD